MRQDLVQLPDLAAKSSLDEHCFDERGCWGLRLLPKFFFCWGRALSACFIFNSQLCPFSSTLIFHYDGEHRVLPSTTKYMVTSWTMPLFASSKGEHGALALAVWRRYDFVMCLTRDLPFPRGCLTLESNRFLTCFKVNSVLRPNICPRSLGEKSFGQAWFWVGWGDDFFRVHWPQISIEWIYSTRVGFFAWFPVCMYYDFIMQASDECIAYH